MNWVNVKLLSLWSRIAAALSPSARTDSAQHLRDLIGEEILPERRTFSRAVFMCVLTAAHDRELAAEAVRLAGRHELIVMSQEPGRMILLANYEPTLNWPFNLICFFERLSVAAGPHRPLRCSASMGPASIYHDNRGMSGDSDDIRLVPEMARRAGSGQMIVTSKVWHALADSLEGWETVPYIFTVSGFPHEIPGMKLEPRLAQAGNCPHCGTEMVIKQTEEGYIRLSCRNGHSSEKTLNKTG